jgi:hypothetical protein
MSIFSSLFLVVLSERNGDLIAHVKFTVLLLSGGTTKVAGLTRPEGFVSDKILPEDIQAILAQEDPKKKKRAKKSKASAATDAAVDTTA